MENPLASDWQGVSDLGDKRKEWNDRSVIAFWIRCYQDHYQVKFPLRSDARANWWRISRGEIRLMEEVFHFTCNDIAYLIAWFWGLKAEDCVGHIHGLHYTRFCIDAYQKWRRSRHQLLSTIETPEELLEHCRRSRLSSGKRPYGNQDEIRMSIKQGVDALADEKRAKNHRNNFTSDHQYSIF